MIWLLSHHLFSPAPPSVTHRKTEKKRQLADGRERRGEKPNHTTARKPSYSIHNSIFSALYIIFSYHTEGRKNKRKVRKIL
jgi:hypothetical protein